MSIRSLPAVCLSALAGAAFLIGPLGPASAFTIAGPSIAQNSPAATVDKVQWRHRGWGWGPGAVVGGLAAGALLGGYYGGYYGPGYYTHGPYYAYGPGYYGDCWRDYWGRVRCG